MGTSKRTSKTTTPTADEGAGKVARSTVPPEAEVQGFEDALEAGYIGHAPGKDNDHTVAGVTSTAAGDQPAGEPTGTDNGGNQ